ncbi:MAG TPA: dipeptidase [Thermoguttaceae bacterium]|nr:dipeptidase [Thermoguttaceae bacterium]
MPAIDEYLASQAERFEQELCQLLRIPSVSADPACRNDIDRTADWVAKQFRRLDFTTEVVQTAGHPLVLAESPPVEGTPTVLVYGHYDVQPPEPLDQWDSPPFTPTRRDGNIYARGAADDKGQMLTHLFSAEAWIAVRRSLPVNLKFLIEGEEEVGSMGLEQFIAEHPERLACDCIVVSDGCQFGPGQPAITYGLRGILYFELELTGPNRDLHSGSFGGSVTNPANALATILAALLDERGKVQIPGFYDDVVPISEPERRQFAMLPFDEKQYWAQLGVSDAAGEAGYTALERRWARPTFDVCGLTSGYQGQGAKTVLPAKASAKISFRLVPKQDPKKITEALRARLAELCPLGISLKLTGMAGSPGLLVPLDSPYVQAAARAIEYAFGRSPVFTREGGSIPIIATMHKTLGADALLLGWGQDDDNTHSPNEKLSLADFHRGIKASARLWQELSKIRVGDG